MAVSLALVLSAIAGLLGMFQSGFNLSCVNTPQPKIVCFLIDNFKSRYNVTLTEEDAVVHFTAIISIYLVGSIIGGLAGGWLADRYGRQRVLYVVQVFNILGGLCQALTQPISSYEILLAGRLIIGITGGILTTVVPVYLAEISPVSIRGLLGALNNLTLIIGAVVGMVTGINHVMGTAGLWHWSLGLNVPLGALNAAFLAFSPESPKYLVLTRGKVREGRRALTKLRPSRTTEEELDEEMRVIKSEGNSAADQNDNQLTVMQVLKTPGLRFSLLVYTMSHLSIPLSGMTGIFFYTTIYFKRAGLSEDFSQYVTIGMCLLVILSSVATLPMMDRVGRRTLFLVSYFVAFVSLCMASAAMIYGGEFEDDESPSKEDWTCGSPTSDPKNTKQETSSALDNPGGESKDQNVAVIFQVVCTVIYVLAVNVGPQPVRWILVGELFRQNARGSAGAFAVFASSLFALIVGAIFPAMTTTMKQFVFLPFNFMTAGLLAFMFMYLPETKDRPVHQTAALFEDNAELKTLIGLQKDAPIIKNSKNHSATIES